MQDIRYAPKACRIKYPSDGRVVYYGSRRMARKARRDRTNAQDKHAPIIWVFKRKEFKS